MPTPEELLARTLQEAPELREPLPLTPEEVNLYADALSQLDYNRLLQEHELVERTYEMTSAALPEWRLTLDYYPHPLVQQRLLVMNEVYKRAQANPEMAYAHHRNRAMMEWGLAGAVVGGLIGAFAKDRLWLGAAAGGVLGVVAGRSQLLQTILTDITSRAALI